MNKPTQGDNAFSDSVRLFVERHTAISLTLVRMRRESEDDPPGASSLKELLNELKKQLADANLPRRVEVARFARSFSTPIDVAGDTYRSAFHAVVDIANRVLLARYNDYLAPLAVLVDDLCPKSGPNGMKWNEVRESIVHQAEVSRIHLYLTIAAESIEEALAHGLPEPKPSEREADLWLGRLALLGRGKPDAGGKALWRRLSAISHEKGRRTFTYNESFGRPKPAGGWNGAHHDARNKLRQSPIQEKPILGFGGRGQHILNWRLPKWFLVQLERDHPQKGT